MAGDFDELSELAADLTSAPAEVAPFVKVALRGTAMEIKKGWAERARVSHGSYPRGYARSIDFDEKDNESGPEVEIGPNLGKNGGSAGFLEDAPGGVRAAPQHAGRDALEAAEKDFVRGIDAALADGLAKSLGAS